MNVCIWSRIPKTGSTSLHNRLVSGGIRDVGTDGLQLIESPRAIVLSCGHATPAMLRDRRLLQETTLRKAFVFTVVRNPWARMASLYFGVGKERRGTNSFEKFVLRGLRDRSFVVSSEGTPVGATMDEWLLLDGLPVCDLVLRFERLDEDFPALDSRLGLDPAPLGMANVNNHPFYTDVHTRATIDAIAEAEAYCISRFGYRYGEDTKAEIPQFSRVLTPADDNGILDA